MPTYRTTRLLWPAVAVLLGTAAQAAPAIRVTVNGTPVALTGAPPVEVKGAVLVPLRGVFQALGATVRYDPAARVITAEKGASRVTLPLGATAARVNGRTQTLLQPAQVVGGTTLVPLRFVAQALGAYVQWVAAASTVEIKTAEPHLAALPAASGRGPIVGQATGVYADTNPQTITVRVNGVNTSIPLAPQTRLLRAAPGQAAAPVPLGRILPGDQVTVERDADGAAQSVTATSGVVRGTIKSIGPLLADGDRVITLNDGTRVELVAGAPVTMAGRAVALGDVMANEAVVIRTDARNRLGFGIAVVTPDDPDPTPPGQAPPAPATTDSRTPPLLRTIAETAMPPGAVSVEITSFSDDVRGPLRTNGKVSATLSGTPHGKALFAIPGITESVPMRETAPGVYSGVYPVPKNADVNSGAVVGSLTVGTAAAPLVQAEGAVVIDNTAPKVSDISPAKGASVAGDRPLIYGVLSDAGGTGVDPAATHVYLDSLDVTRQATVSAACFSVTPSQPLKGGAHQVRVVAADRGGNSATAEWQFSIAPTASVQSFADSAALGQTLGARETIRFTLNGRPGGQASVKIGSVAPSIPLGEGRPGVYTGEYTVRPGDNAQNAPVSALFKPPGAPTIIVPLSTGLTIAAGPPRPPRFTYPPIDDVLVGEALDVEGRATPGATVRVSVDYVSKALGGLFPITGAAPGVKEVQADKDGRWKVERIPLDTRSLFVKDRDTVFTISAVTVAGSGVLSEPVHITARRG